MNVQELKEQSAALLGRARLSLSEEEIASMEAADFGLARGRVEGAQIITLFSTGSIAGKVIVLLPGQTLPEHAHVHKGGNAPKEELLRVVLGTLFLYVDGPGDDASRIPAGREHVYTARTPVVLRETGQHLIAPGTRHWLAAGEEGCVVCSFSTAAYDRSDVFTDPGVVR